MFVDFQDVESNDGLEFDLCIVGAGAAGITLAKKLGTSGLRVALLESGGFSSENDTQLLCDGSSSWPEYMPLIASRLRLFGGTTGHWAGQSIPMDEHDFLTRDWVPHSGWPITFQEFSQYLGDAADICGVPRGGYRWKDVQHTEELTFPFDGGALGDSLMRLSAPPRRFGEYYRDEIGASKNITCFLHANVTEIVANEAGSHVEHL